MILFGFQIETHVAITWLIGLASGCVGGVLSRYIGDALGQSRSLRVSKRNFIRAIGAEIEFLNEKVCRYERALASSERGIAVQMRMIPDWDEEIYRLEDAYRIRDSDFAVYRANLQTLGVFPENITRSIVYFYLTMQRLDVSYVGFQKAWSERQEDWINDSELTKASEHFEEQIRSAIAVGSDLSDRLSDAVTTPILSNIFGSREIHVPQTALDRIKDREFDRTVRPLGECARKFNSAQENGRQEFKESK